MVKKPAVSFAHITMRFPGVLANDDISLDIQPGEIFALVGENGAGKSTLMNILYGLHAPTSGYVAVKGKTIAKYSPAAAIARGVGMVHQHFMLVPSFTVAQNIALAREPRKRGLFYDFAAAEKTVRSLSAEYGLSIDPNARVRDLNLGLQQRVEILKTLSRGADILILDEPTAVLTPQETDELFAVIRRIVRERGITVLLITHKLYEVIAVSDRVGVMRLGKLAGVFQTKDVDERALASMMVGDDVLFHDLDRHKTQNKDAGISVSSLHVLNDRNIPAVNGISFEVRRGEIVGIAGIEGNGQQELVEAITGLRPAVSGDVWICGKQAAGLSPGEIRKLGLSHIPEDRMATGISKAASLSDNLLAGKQRDRAFSLARIHLKRRAKSAYARALYQRYDIRGTGVDSPAGSLSGGNIQKLVVAREFSFETPVLIISQPTRGVDIGAIEYIHRRIIEKRNDGNAILLISADLDEVLRLSDRVLTIYEGRFTGEFSATPYDKAEIGYRMTGGAGDGGEGDAGKRHPQTP